MKKNKIYYDAFPNTPGLSKKLGLTKNENPQAFIGKWFNKKQWYSICSKHREPNKDCSICKVGNYNNVYYIKFKHLVYKLTGKII